MTVMEMILLAAVVVLVLGNAYLAAVETVLTRIDVVRALRLEEEDMAGAASLVWVTRRRAMAANVLLVVKVLVRVLVVALATVLARTLGDDTVPVIVLGLVAFALVVLVLAEITPRTLVLRHLETAGLRLAASARLLVLCFSPLARVLVSIGRALVPRRGEISGPFASDDELRTRELDPGEHEELEPEERAMIHSIFELADTRVRAVMTPRPDVVLVSIDAPMREVVGLVLEHGISRLPVHAADDNGAVVGIVHAKDLLGHLADDTQDADGWHELIRDPFFVPETKRCDDLLRDLRVGAIHLAVVVDEHGEFVGLVTIEDILEEIVGEIVDEYDREEPLVGTLADGTFRVDARLGVNDLNELLGTSLPEEGWDTVGGLVYATLGRIPDAGESIELDGTTITVEQVNGRRIGKVQVRHTDPHAPDGEVHADAGQPTAHEGPRAGTDSAPQDFAADADDRRGTHRDASRSSPQQRVSR